jgi:hypothetical protein
MRRQPGESDIDGIFRATGVRADFRKDMWNACLGIICSCWRSLTSIIDVFDNLRQQRVSGLQKPHDQRDSISLQLLVERVDCELQDEGFESDSKRIWVVSNKFDSHVDNCFS